MNNNKVFNIFTVINLALLCVCLIGCVYVIAYAESISIKIEAVAEIIATLAVIQYFAMGAKKDAAKFYKTFLLLEAGTFLIDMLGFIFEGPVTVPAFYLFLILILYGNTLLLAIAKDLGKATTLSLASFNLTVYTVLLIIAFINGAAKTDVVNFILNLTWFALAGITLLMTIAKYMDKKARNTK